MVQTSNYIESKYHSLYIITGLIMSKYDIDAYNLKITSIGEMDKIFIEWFCKKHEVYVYEMLLFDGEEKYCYIEEQTTGEN